MKPRSHALGLFVTALATALSCAGCSSDTPTTTSPVRATASTSTAVPGPSPATATPTASPTASATADSPGQGLETPATTSGALSVASFPEPGKLGPGWEYTVDPGSMEDGYLGNDTPAMSRNPAELVQTAVPLGCLRPNPMAPPQHVLEVDYAYQGTTVIMVRSSFADASAAAAFYRARKDNLHRCLGRIAVRAEGVLVGRVDELSTGVLLSDRTPTSAAWTELCVLDRDQVVLVAARTNIAASPMARPKAQRLAALVRR